MLKFKMDVSEKGLRKILREYEELALRYLWNNQKNSANSRQIWDSVRNELSENKSISRTSIIFFLDDMQEQSVLGFKSTTGKGGIQRQYYPLMDEKEFVKQLSVTCIESLMKDFPDETKKVLNLYARALT